MVHAVGQRHPATGRIRADALVLGTGEEEGGGSAEPVSGPALPALNISLCGPGRERPEAVGESHASGSVESCFLGIAYPTNTTGSNPHPYSPPLVSPVPT